MGRLRREQTLEVAYFVPQQSQLSSPERSSEPYIQHRLPEELGFYSYKLPTCLSKRDIRGFLSQRHYFEPYEKNKATLACFRLGKASLMFPNLSAFFRIYKDASNCSHNISVEVNTDSTVLLFFHLYNMKHVNLSNTLKCLQ